MAKKQKKEPKGNWVVKMKCVVIKEFYVEDATEQQATESPFSCFISGEQELEMPDWEVMDVSSNK